jgi:DNA-binding MarR family transcriptional regulator
MTDTPDSLVLGLQVLATLVRRGPLDTERLARLNGWRHSDAAAVVGVLEQEGLVRQVGDPAQLVVTSRAAALFEESSMTLTVH